MSFHQFLGQCPLHTAWGSLDPLFTPLPGVLQMSSPALTHLPGKVNTPCSVLGRVCVSKMKVLQ